MVRSAIGKTSSTVRRSHRRVANVSVYGADTSPSKATPQGSSSMQTGDTSSVIMKRLINEFSLQDGRGCIKTKNGHQRVLERGQSTGTAALTTECAAGVIPNDRSLLIVDDDHSFLNRLAHAMEARG